MNDKKMLWIIELTTSMFTINISVLLSELICTRLTLIIYSFVLFLT